jgi:hypothetical protein
LLTPLWCDGFRYGKAGVILNGFVPAGEQQRLFATRRPKPRKTMAVMDAINAQHGHGALLVASTDLARS